MSTRSIKRTQNVSQAERYRQQVRDILRERNVDQHLGRRYEEKPPMQKKQTSGAELFENYDSVLSSTIGSSLSEWFGVPLDTEAIQIDTLMATLYMSDVPTEAGIKALTQSYRGDPDGSDFFEEGMTGPIAFNIAKAVSLRSADILVPTRIQRCIDDWRTEYEEERMPDETVIRQLLHTQITSQYELSRYLDDWAIKTTTPQIVWSGISKSATLSGYNGIVNNAIEIGESIEIPYFMSTSYDVDVAKRFTGRDENKHMLCILLPACVSLSIISESTSSPVEREMLLNIGSVLRKIKEPYTSVDGYHYYFYTLERFHLPPKKQVVPKIKEATRVWCEQLGIPLKKTVTSRTRSTRKSPSKR